MYAVIFDEVFTAITCFTVHFILFDYKLRAESIANSKLAAEKLPHLADTQLDSATVIMHSLIEAGTSICKFQFDCQW